MGSARVQVPIDLESSLAMRGKYAPSEPFGEAIGSIQVRPPSNAVAKGQIWIGDPIFGSRPFQKLSPAIGSRVTLLTILKQRQPAFKSEIVGRVRRINCRGFRQIRAWCRVEPVEMT